MIDKQMKAIHKKTQQIHVHIDGLITEHHDWDWAVNGEEAGERRELEIISDNVLCWNDCPFFRPFIGTANGKKAHCLVTGDD